MKVTIIPSDEFSRQFKRLAKKYKSLGKDYLDFRKEIADNPFQGANLGNGIHKVRMSIASKGKGKSGGARVLTLVMLVSNDAEVTLLTIYDKGEISNVSDSYIKQLIRNL